jgi:hypothetical protein
MRKRFLVVRIFVDELQFSKFGDSERMTGKPELNFQFAKHTDGNSASARLERCAMSSA